MARTSIKTKGRAKNNKKPAQAMVKIAKKVVKSTQETEEIPAKEQLTVLIKWGKKFRVVEMPDGSAVYLKIQDVNPKNLPPEYTSVQIIGDGKEPKNKPNSSRVVVSQTVSQTTTNMLRNVSVEPLTPIVG